MPGRTIAVIGSGIAGLSCAEQLQSNGWSVILFDKGRGPGGRLSTRRSPAGPFDHGTPSFAATDPAFLSVVHQWCDAGLVAPWHHEADATSPAEFVGTPKMNALLSRRADAIGVAFGIRVAPLPARPDALDHVLYAENGEALASAGLVVTATPPPQAAALLQTVSPAVAARLRTIGADAIWTVMAAFEHAVPNVPHVLRPDGKGALAVCIRDSAKPGRAAGERWVLHASTQWSKEHLEADPDWVVEALIGEFHAVTGCSPPGAPRHAQAHRWRYARAHKPLNEEFFLDRSAGVAACGDGFCGDSVEAAWRSGMALAAEIGAPVIG